MICPSCGGEYADWAIKCPYCGITNESADEKAYLSHLEELKNRLDQVDEEAEESYKREFSGGLSKFLRIAIAAAVILILLAIGSHFLTNYLDARDEDLNYAQTLWEKEEFPKLDKWYENGEYEKIIEEYQNLLSSDYHIYNWTHYYFVIEYYYPYSDLIYVKQRLEAGEIPESYYIGEALYSALSLCYEANDERLDQLKYSLTVNKNHGITDEEAEEIKDFRETARAFFSDTLKWSEDEVDAFYNECLENGFIRISPCFDKADELVKELK